MADKTQNNEERDEPTKILGTACSSNNLAEGDKAPQANGVGYGIQFNAWFEAITSLTKGTREESIFSSQVMTEDDQSYFLDGYIALVHWANYLMASKKAIYDAIDSTYNGYIEGNKIDSMAFQILQGGHDGVSDLNEYKNTQQEFVTRPEYASATRTIYQIQTKLNSQSWWKAKYQSCFDKVEDVVKDYQEYFESIQEDLELKENTETTEDGDGGEVEYDSKATKFWSTEHKTLQGKVYSTKDLTQRLEQALSQLSTMLNSGYSFSNLQNTVATHKTVYLDGMAIVGYMDSILTATQDEESNLAPILNTVGYGGFGPYSTKLQACFNKLQECIAIRDASKYRDLERQNVYLRKITHSEVLKNIDFVTGGNRNFYEISKGTDDWMNSFKNYWSL